MCKPIDWWHSHQDQSKQFLQFSVISSLTLWQTSSWIHLHVALSPRHADNTWWGWGWSWISKQVYSNVMVINLLTCLINVIKEYDTSSSSRKCRIRCLLYNMTTLIHLYINNVTRPSWSLKQLNTRLLVYCLLMLKTEEHQRKLLLASLREIQQSPLDSSHYGPAVNKTFPWHDVPMIKLYDYTLNT